MNLVENVTFLCIAWGNEFSGEMSINGNACFWIL